MMPTTRRTGRKGLRARDMELHEHAAEIDRRLREHYPSAHCALDFKTPFQLAVATILSAQCTDKRVNMVTPALFKRYRTPAALASANPADVEDLIKSTGFYRAKTKSLIGMARSIVDRHGGKVPRTMEELVKLP